MDEQLKAALMQTIQNWESIARADADDAESAADSFEQSFYQLIDLFRGWVNTLDQKPESVEQLLELDTSQAIIRHLPEPLYLNFETEAELIIDNIERIQEDKYD